MVILMPPAPLLDLLAALELLDVMRTELLEAPAAALPPDPPALTERSLCDVSRVVVTDFVTTLLLSPPPPPELTVLTVVRLSIQR